jgi:hypothetical protein
MFQTNLWRKNKYTFYAQRRLSENGDVCEIMWENARKCGKMRENVGKCV